MTITNRVSLKSVMGGNTPIPDVPDAPTIGAATNVGTSRAYNDGSATVAYTAAPTGGAVTTFTATSTPGSFTGTGSSPITVTGLQSATSYTFTVTPTNSTATGPASSASSSITATTVPQAPTIGTFTDGGNGTTGTLSFTAGATGGSTITNYKYSTDSSTYTALSPAQTSSPLSLTGLTAGTYNFSVKAVNANGDSAASSTVSGTVITPSSYESIATATGTGSSGVITFSSIPSTYKHLQIRILGRTTAAQTNTDLYVQYNSSTSGYANHAIQGNGSITETKTDINGSYIIIYQSLTGASAATSIMGAAIIDIPDYASTTKNKTLRCLSGQTRPADAQGAIWLQSGFLNNTAALSSLSFTLGSGSWTTSSVISLYGIKG